MLKNVYSVRSYLKILGRLTFDDVFKALHLTALTIHFVQSWDLNQPANIMGEKLIMNDPFGKVIPFRVRSPIDRDSPLAVLKRRHHEVCTSNGQIVTTGTAILVEDSLL